MCPPHPSPYISHSEVVKFTGQTLESGKGARGKGRGPRGVGSLDWVRVGEQGTPSPRWSSSLSVFEAGEPLPPYHTTASVHHVAVGRFDGAGVRFGSLITTALVTEGNGCTCTQGAARDP